MICRGFDCVASVHVAQGVCTIELIGERGHGNLAFLYDEKMGIRHFEVKDLSRYEFCTIIRPYLQALKFKAKKEGKEIRFRFFDNVQKALFEYMKGGDERLITRQKGEPHIVADFRVPHLLY